MNISDIQKIVILIETPEGNAHQVLASKENKEICLQILAQAEGGLRVTKEIMPIEFIEKQP